MAHESDTRHANRLRFSGLGIDTGREAVIYMRADCLMCRSEGGCIAWGGA